MLDIIFHILLYLSLCQGLVDLGSPWNTVKNSIQYFCHYHCCWLLLRAFLKWIGSMHLKHHESSKDRWSWWWWWWSAGNIVNLALDALTIWFPSCRVKHFALMLLYRAVCQFYWFTFVVGCEVIIHRLCCCGCRSVSRYCLCPMIRRVIYWLFIMSVVMASGLPHVLRNVVGGMQGHVPCIRPSLQQGLFLCQLNFFKIIRLSQCWGESGRLKLLGILPDLTHQCLSLGRRAHDVLSGCSFLALSS